jgi:hypothetical protein
MDLLLKTILGVVIVVVVIIGIYYLLQHVVAAGTVTQQQAETLVYSYLENHNPNATINITNVTPSQFQGSWHIVVSLVNNPTRPCPSYYIYSFDYPKYGFVNRTEETYTENCVINGLIANQSYAIGAYPVAIARSTSLNVSNVTDYVNMYGYNNTVVHAAYYGNLAVGGATYVKAWFINYTSPLTKRYVYTVISQTNGSLLASYASP